MRIDVALVPAEAKRWPASVTILVDQLRASSTIVALLDGGADAVVPASSLADARRTAREIGPKALLAGEHRVIRAPGFDIGNSPAEAIAADVAGRTVVLATRNGTAVLRALPADLPIYVGCLLNATAVARAAFGRARDEHVDLGILCAGRRGTFAIDDAIAAGALLERVLSCAGVDDRGLVTADGRFDRRAPRPEDPDELVLTDAARAALQLWRSTPEVGPALSSSFSGRILAAVDLLGDVDVSLRIDSSSVVPVVRPAGLPRIERDGAERASSDSPTA